MAFCMNCGQQLPEGAKFCSSCGTATGEVKSETVQRKTVYDGELHKCPNCGELINAFVTICPTCNYELRSTKASSVVKEFADKLEKIEASREIKKADFFNGNANELTKTDEQKINLIRSFAIPNTKEDIYEFLILAASNISIEWWRDTTVAQEAESSAWVAKFEQAYRKAVIMFEDEPTFQRLEKMYKEKLFAIKMKKWKFPLIWIGSLVGILLMGLVMVLIFSIAGITK